MPVAPIPTRTRVVIFMTAHQSNDIPGTDSPLACLLPLGSSTFAERLLDSCIQAGVRHVDVVVSDYPENVRAVLGDGSAWGLHIAWHLAKNAHSAYTVLQSLNFSAEDLVVIGHAHQWIAPRILAALVENLQRQCMQTQTRSCAGRDGAANVPISLVLVPCTKMKRS